ncbi:MAG TPA: trypsin-like peptidase domain-containing protein, partial [Nocardioidaceae bacterium]|nr:trypsin-like peptidase domain-containing protein [Nocardioidaceae bacterium]
MSAGDMNAGYPNDGREQQPNSDNAHPPPGPSQSYGAAGTPPTQPPPHHGGYAQQQDPASAYTHRYASAQAPQQNYAGMGSPEQGDKKRSRKPRAALIVAAALVAGVLGGGVGAAGFNAFDDDSNGAADAVTGTTLDQTVSTPDKKVTDGTIEAVAKKVRPSVVQINVQGSGMADSGTGIIISKDGTIVTNNHVVAAAAERGSITVSFNDNSTAKAEIVGQDPVTDIAVVKAEDVSGLKPATLGSSSDLRVGQDVVAVGSPFGLESTVTSGIVSALNRPVAAGDSTGGSSNVYPAIQTDAAINPGNSGGPLVDMNGNVVGINSSIRSNSSGTQAGSIGLGFAIPIDLARNIAKQLID